MTNETFILFIIILISGTSYTMILPFISLLTAKHSIEHIWSGFIISIHAITFLLTLLFNKEFFKYFQKEFIFQHVFLIEVKIKFNIEAVCNFIMILLDISFNKTCFILLITLCRAVQGIVASLFMIISNSFFRIKYP